MFNPKPPDPPATDDAPGSEERVTARVGAAPDWDIEWQAAWKAHPANPWFQYQADAYAAWLCWPATVNPRRVLKTDAFDEACGFKPLDRTFRRARVVLMDVSPRILGQAVRNCDGVTLACATDVRRLAFRRGAFDLIFSPSTLDHFDKESDIETAFGEIHRALQPGGRLLVTLDNPANPMLRLRQAVYRISGPLGGLIPFRMGRTLSRTRLVAVLERVGFQVHKSGYLLHAPRVLGLWLGEWAARRGKHSLARRLRATFGWAERVAARLPTRRWTGHFVVADCRRPNPGVFVVGAAGGASLLTTAIDIYKILEHRARCAYLRTFPPPILAWLDPPLRRVAAAVHRAVAVPVYLRQHLGLWSGPCGGETVRIAVWGKPDCPRQLFDMLFDAMPSVRWHGLRTLPAVLRSAPDLVEGADLVIAETTPALAPAFRRRGFLIVPGAVRFGGEPEALVAAQTKAAKTLRSDTRLAQRARYRIAIWPYTRERSTLFYHRYLLPHVQLRFGGRARPMAFDWVDRLFAAGFAVTLSPAGSDQPDVIGILLTRGHTLWFPRLGTRDGDPAIVRAGGIAALYDFVIRFAHERRMRLIDFGRSSPWRTDGVVRYKWKWGLRPIIDTNQTLEYAVKILRPDSSGPRRLAERQVIVRDGVSFFVMSPGDLLTAK